MKKELGQFFTPKKTVLKMLKNVDFTNIFNKTFFEPSFGDGIFLRELLYILINEKEYQGISDKEFYNYLNNNIYGVEIDEEYYNKTKNILNTILEDNKLRKINWDNLYNLDFFDFKPKIKFNYIIGNPPYIKVHDFDQKHFKLINSFKFGFGNTDLYIMFFEVCLDYLYEGEGKLVFITPNSYFRNTSQKPFREYLVDNNLIESICDYGSNLIFKDVSTYTAITVLNNNKTTNCVRYTKHNGIKDEYSVKYSIDELKSMEKWGFVSKNNKDILNKRMNGLKKLSDYIDCQYGITTNRNKVYINKVDDKNLKLYKDNKNLTFNGVKIEPNLLRPAIKGSVYEGKNYNTLILYPYNDKGKAILEKDLKKYPKTYKYLLKNKEELEKRSMDGNTQWYEYARSQGLKNICNQKIVFKHMFPSSLKEIDFHIVDKNIIMYSGIYITSKKVKLDTIVDILKSPDFLIYAKAISKDMQNDYLVIKTKDILNYSLTLDETNMLNKAKIKPL